MKKFKALPLLLQILLLGMGLGLCGAIILRLFKVELGSLWSGVMFVAAMVGSYFIVTNNN